ncbi:hypothetical protein BGZ72_009939 [Mortierella alpina]|nr:hypothetical protein BGZ72_009939 [Mortierella alpina]
MSLTHAARRPLKQNPAGDSNAAALFDIPLLVELVARHLTTRDIYRCTLVDHQFHDAFQRSLYTCICIEQEATLEKFSRQEAVSAFSSRLSYVKGVSTVLGRCVEHLLKQASSQRVLRQGLCSTPMLFGNLTIFRFVPTKGFLGSSEALIDVELYSNSILSFLEACPALQVLHLSCFAVHSHSLVFRLAKVIRERGRRLKEFRIACPEKRIGRTKFYTLLWSCAAVEVLHMGVRPHSHRSTIAFSETLLTFNALAREALSGNERGSHLAQSEAPAMPEFSQRREKIELAWKELGPGGWLTRPDFETVHGILGMCPFLERLVIPRLIEQDIVTRLAPVVATVMPELCHLNLTYISNQRLGTYHLVQACRELISLNLGTIQFDSNLLVDAVVSQHGHSLQSLNLGKSATLSSRELILILNKCLRLKELYALSPDYELSSTVNQCMLETKDMAMAPDEPGWGCMDLEVLQLCYSGEDMDIGIPEVLWRQIAQLSKLKDLRLYRHTSRKGPPVGEKESVRQAVSSWATLSDLRRLELRALSAFVDETLMSTARNQWAKLEWVRYKYD